METLVNGLIIDDSTVKLGRGIPIGLIHLRLDMDNDVVVWLRSESFTCLVHCHSIRFDD